MRKLRTGKPQPVIEWVEADIMAHLGCDQTKAKEIMKECRSKYDLSGYGAIERHYILDFINEKQRVEREREARYNADIAVTRQVAVLKEQVRTLKTQNQTLQSMCESSSADARKARTQSLVANFISGISLVIAVLALVLKLY
nr:MAG TPA: hypothetical protein [Caudoviricetes sp.]